MQLSTVLQGSYRWLPVNLRVRGIQKLLAQSTTFIRQIVFCALHCGWSAQVEAVDRPNFASQLIHFNELTETVDAMTRPETESEHTKLRSSPVFWESKQGNGIMHQYLRRLESPECMKERPMLQYQDRNDFLSLYSAITHRVLCTMHQ